MLAAIHLTNKLSSQKMQKIMRFFYPLFLSTLFSLNAKGQNRTLPYMEAPDAITMQFADGITEGGIVLSYNPVDETYNVLLSPGTGLLKIERSGKILLVQSPRDRDQRRLGTRLVSWNYLQYNRRIFRVGRTTRVVLSFDGNVNDTYLGIIQNYTPRTGYDIAFLGPGPTTSRDIASQYYVQIGPNLRVRRTNIPDLQGKTLHRINIMTQVCPDNSFPY